MKILVKAIAGSHLFGTATEKSDRDYKGVFLPSADDILLGKFDQTINQSTNNVIGQKNGQNDVDIELYSLDKFLKMLFQGQTVAWELLFTPDHMILEKHPLWDTIVKANTEVYLNKNISAFLGYCRQQAHKYGVRGSRMNTLEKVLNILNKYVYMKDIVSNRNNWTGKEMISDYNLEDIYKNEFDEIVNLEHVDVIADKNGKDLVHICGKKFGLDTNLQHVVQPLQKYYADYGERSRKAKENEGIDWKALSHAVRVCMQAISLLDNHKILLPMAPGNVLLLKSIKAGELSFDNVAHIIETYQDMLQKAVENSTLPEQANLEAFQGVQKRIYTMIIKGEI